ncbi:hypothetical protein [Sandarakinorhabdus cyanobacteriorum]|uniref:hypothetical protein n=1 Tax=Sandarakinorhabdus cyanobacteriorum TaxID=1981098 RepID=UPI0013FDC1DD|nr:hypothetical protein [Sandarakinorhabdus cyanobacteriorum]
MNTAGLVVRLRAQGAALAAALVARVRRDGQARFGRRDRLADPRILWPARQDGGDER